LWRSDNPKGPLELRSAVPTVQVPEQNVKLLNLLIRGLSRQIQGVPPQLHTSTVWQCSLRYCRQILVLCLLVDVQRVWGDWVVGWGLRRSRMHCRPVCLLIY
jgi:hypothetical protein